MPAFEEEDIDLTKQALAKRLKKEFLAKKKRQADKRKKEIGELENMFNLEEDEWNTQ